MLYTQNPYKTVHPFVGIILHNSKKNPTQHTAIIYGFSKQSTAAKNAAHVRNAIPEE